MDQLDENLAGWWVKLFVIHMLMRARPDVEWLLWMDSDAVFTNMTFQFPLEKYKDHNMVLQGDDTLFKEKNWLGLNTGQNSLHPSHRSSLIAFPKQSCGLIGLNIENIR